MFDLFQRISEMTGLEPQFLITAGVFVGAFLVFLSLVITFQERGRMHLADGMSVAPSPAINLFVAPEADPSDVAKIFLPTKRRERAQVRRDLAHAGFNGPNAVITYYLVRSAIGLVLPAALAALVLLRDKLPVPPIIDNLLGEIGTQQMLIGLAIMILVGFYGPAAWLSARAAERRERIEQSFPNALDLLQISIESGLGFDAALSRVSSELSIAAPDVSNEFNMVQRETLAGRDREAAYQDMAERLNIDEAFSFVNVVLQSMRFGTSMSQALLAYSADMRQRREIRAQEKANKLPVYMSAVMASLMMPSLLIVTIGPVALRYMSAFN